MEDGATSTLSGVRLVRGIDANGNSINFATEETLSQIVMAVNNAIDSTAFNLNAAAFSAVTAISNDFIFDSIEFNFSTAEAKTITITSSDGTILWGGAVDTTAANQGYLSTARNIYLEFNRGFVANDNIAVAVTQLSSAGTMDCILKTRSGTDTLLGNPVLGAGANLFGIPYDFALEAAKGNVPDHSLFNTFGEKDSVAITVNGDDVWAGVATTMPTPPSAGEEMTMVSTSVNDTTGGTGARLMEVMYLDGNGDEQIHEQALNGTTPVDLTVTDIAFVNFFHTDIVGSNGVAVGDITIYKKGDPSTIYNVVKAGGNMSTTCVYKVPAGKKLYIKSWYGTQTGRKPTKLRLRSTDHHGAIHEGVFLFKDAMFLDGTALELEFCPPLLIPALSIIKVSAWATATGGDVSAGFKGYLNN